ncbi:15053_t:CDS:2 [Funneliformis geosporum]|nr:15053_t:CDS:2 [Funneliformis geosporum]
MKDVQTYQYYKDSMRIQSTYRVQLEENDAHIEIGKNTGKYTICGSLSTDLITKLKDFLYRNINSFATTIQDLQWLLNQPTKEKDSKRIIRWKIILQQFQFEVKYRKGKANANADTLSQINELQTPNSLESTSIIDHG